MLGDFVFLFKLFVFAMVVRWLGSLFGNNPTIFAISLLVVGYYIFFEQWSFFGLLFLFFVVFLMSGLGTFMQDIIFQYGSVRELEMTGEQHKNESTPYLPYMMFMQKK